MYDAFGGGWIRAIGIHAAKDGQQTEIVQDMSIGNDRGVSHDDAMVQRGGVGSRQQQSPELVAYVMRSLEVTVPGARGVDGDARQLFSKGGESLPKVRFRARSSWVHLQSKAHPISLEFGAVVRYEEHPREALQQDVCGLEQRDVVVPQF